MKTFENKTVLITEGISGIGKTLPWRLPKKARMWSSPADALPRERRSTGDEPSGQRGQIRNGSTIYETKIYLSSGTRPPQHKNCTAAECPIPTHAIMKAIDLTTQPPRSPYQKMEGLYMMPRTIDKLRAKLPGGKIGAYSITTAFGPGLSLMLLDDIGVTEKCLLEIVQKVSVEHEIADWLRRNADLSSVASLNEKLFSPRIEDVLAFIPAATFNEIYPVAERMTITSPMFEVLLEDDRLMFPNHFQNGSASARNAPIEQPK